MSLTIRSPRSKAAAAAAGAAAASKASALDKRKAPHIKVCVRIRPLNSSEARNDTVVEVVDGNTLIFDPEYGAAKGSSGSYSTSLTSSMMLRGTGAGGGGVRRGKNSAFGFDHVYDVKATQEEVYRGATEGLVRSVLEGFNASVFAYGATGSGKTYTMMGNETTPGVMGLAMQELWEAIEESKDEYSYEVKVSCLEVYNEKLYDLFAADAPYLEIREDDSGNVCVPRLSVEHPRTVEEVQSMLAIANSRRKQMPTDANAESSRSHAVFQVTVLRTPRTVGLTAPTSIGKLSLIDLAGSERASQSKNRNKQLIEGANINRSLLALNSCINALGQNGRSKGHIPYRNSNLTRLLKDSLGGTARTTMIANISPATRSYEDTFNTLTYASNAKNIRINARPKTEDARTHISNYKAIIESLTEQVTELKARVASLEGERSRCSCSAKDATHNALLDRARSVCSERAGLLWQLEALSNRLRAFAGIKYADDEEPPLLRESRDTRERILREIKANDLRALRLSNEVDRLPKQKRAALMADITGVTGDMVAAHGAFMKAVVREDFALLRTIFSSGAISPSSPILPKLQTAILIGDSASEMSPLSFVPTPFPSSSSMSSSMTSSISAAKQSSVTEVQQENSISQTEMDFINVSGSFRSDNRNAGVVVPAAKEGAITSSNNGTPRKPHPTIDDLAMPANEFSFNSNAAKTPLKNIYTLAHSSPFKSVKRTLIPDNGNGATSTIGSNPSNMPTFSPLKRSRLDNGDGTTTAQTTALPSSNADLQQSQLQTIVFPSVPSFSLGSPEEKKDYQTTTTTMTTIPSSPQRLSESTTTALYSPRPKAPTASSLTLSSTTLALLQQQKQQDKDNRATDLINKAASFTTGRPFIPSAPSSLTSSSSSSLREQKRILAKPPSNALESGGSSSSGVTRVGQVEEPRGILRNQSSIRNTASSSNDRRFTSSGRSSKTVTFMEPQKENIYSSDSDSDDDDDDDDDSDSDDDNDDGDDDGRGNAAPFKRTSYPGFTNRVNLGNSDSGKQTNSFSGIKIGSGGSGGGGSNESASSAASFFKPKSRWMSNKF